MLVCNPSSWVSSVVASNLSACLGAQDRWIQKASFSCYLKLHECSVFFAPRTNWSEAVDCNALRPAGDEHYLSDDKIVGKLSWGGRIRGEQGFMEILPEMFKLLNLDFGWRHCRKTPLYSDFLDCRKVSKSLDLLIYLQFTRIYSFPRHGLMTGSKVDMFWRFFFGTFAGRHDDARACLCTGEACR